MKAKEFFTIFNPEKAKFKCLDETFKKPIEEVFNRQSGKGPFVTSFPMWVKTSQDALKYANHLLYRLDEARQQNAVYQELINILVSQLDLDKDQKFYLENFIIFDLIKEASDKADRNAEQSYVASLDEELKK
jgi:hypothetical protein